MTAILLLSQTETFDLFRNVVWCV